MARQRYQQQQEDPANNPASFMPQSDPLQMLGGLVQLFAAMQGTQFAQEDQQREGQAFEFQQQQAAQNYGLQERELQQRDRGLAAQEREIAAREKQGEGNIAYQTAAAEDAKRGRMMQSEENQLRRDALMAEASNRRMQGLAGLLQLIPMDGAPQSNMIRSGIMGLLGEEFGIPLVGDNPDASKASFLGQPSGYSTKNTVPTPLNMF